MVINNNDHNEIDNFHSFFYSFPFNVKQGGGGILKI